MTADANQVNLPLLDQVALITGAGRGLGEALAWRLAEAGAHVVIADIHLDAVQQVAGAIAQATDRRALPVRVDVTDEALVQAMIARIVAEFGRLDLLIANAGIVRSGQAIELASADFRAVIDVNLTGYFLCAKHAVPVMKARQRGCIIQINSVSGRRGSAGNGAYVASKMAGIGLTQSLALELAADGIRVNAVCPGHLLESPLWVDSLFVEYAARDGVTPDDIRRRYEARSPMQRACTYDDVANAVLFLASERAEYMTGQAINVSGGEVMN